MGRYNFLSPGASAGNALVEQLTRAREEQRQRLLDEITQKDSESRRRAAEESIRASEQERELKTLAAATEGLEHGQDVTGNPNLELLRKYSRLGRNPNPQPSVSTETDFGDGETITEGSLPAPKDVNENYYQGTAEDRKRERIKRVAGDFHPGSPMSELSNSDIPLMQKAATISSLFEQPMPPSAFQPNEKPYFTVGATGKVSPVSLGGKPVLAPPGDSPAIRLPQEMRTPLYPFEIPGVPEGESNIVWGNSQTGQMTRATLPPGVTRLRRAGTGEPRAVPFRGVITDAVSNHLDQLIKAASSPNATQDQQDQVYGAMVAAIAGAKVVDPSVKEVAIQVIQSGDERDAEVIGLELLQDPKATKEEVADLVELLRRVRKF